MDRALFVSELHALIHETRRKWPDVRDAGEAALEMLKGGARQDGRTLMEPITRGCGTKNPKVVGICVGALQRLVGMNVVDSVSPEMLLGANLELRFLSCVSSSLLSQTAVPAIIQTLDSVLTHGVDIQLKVLQTILSMLTYCTDVHGAVLGDALLLCFKLHDVKHPVVSSTAAATLRQAVMLVFERVAEEDKALSNTLPTDTHSTTATTPVTPEDAGPSPPIPSEVNIDSLPPALQDAYTLLSDLCILARPPPGRSGGFLSILGSSGVRESEGDEIRSLRLLTTTTGIGTAGIGRTFSLELVESVVAGFEGCLKAVRTALLLCHTRTSAQMCA
ncbi:hypothetical protein QFC19_005145 [Naganishia cerealis]|uniref:Uncharacterized protein n=1 Tax=Naganishia cerealis TaxID=610337 RepID=A0ACC2VQY3_9TREE|nr:hypothetical protein QFC19_005145 [Naganishia cerealis]